MSIKHEFTKGLWQTIPPSIGPGAVSDTGGNHNRHQWYGHGTGHHLCISLLQSLCLTAQTPHPQPGADRLLYCDHIVIIASFVVIVELVMQAYFYSLFKILGIFIPLIVVNCIILGRAEAFASKNNPLVSLADGLGIGLGFTISLFVLGCIREFLGSGTLLEIPVMPLLPWECCLQA